MASRKLIIVYNPVAGRGLAERIAQLAATRLQAAGWHLLTRFATSNSGDLVDWLSQQWSSQAGFIVVVGGDGTLREAVEAISGWSTVPLLGFVPLGNANVIAREWDIPLDPIAAIEVLLNGRRANMDVGCLQSGHQQWLFLAMAEIGYGARIVHWVGRLRSGWLKKIYRWWGDLIYGFASLLAIVRLSESFSLQIQNKHQQCTQLKNCRYLVAANIATYAKGWSLVPMANPSDGELTVMVSQRASRISELQLMLGAARRNIQPERIARYMAADQVEITSEGEHAIFVQIDGDALPPMRQLSIAIQPAQIQLQVPQARHTVAHFQK